MRTYLVGNRCGIMVSREIEASGAEENMLALAEKAGLPPKKRSFIQLLEGEYLILRATDAVPEQAA